VTGNDIHTGLLDCNINYYRKRFYKIDPLEWGRGVWAEKWGGDSTLFSSLGDCYKNFFRHNLQMGPISLEIKKFDNFLFLSLKALCANNFTSVINFVL
jgi:hypothetical protein